LKRSKRAWSYAAALLAVSPVLATPATAQNWKEVPLYGTVELSSGFMPDPVSRSLRAGGADENTISGAGCGGYINAEKPDYDLNYTAGNATLYVYARSDSDVTLLINDPSGAWHCSDDWEGTDPMVAFDDPQSGNYNIWVGTFASGSTQDATLYFTEIDTSGSAGGGDFGDDMPDISAMPVYETIELSAGFTPDPVARSLQAGGSSLNPVSGAGCAGYINLEAPDFDLNYDAGTMPLYIYAEADADITLLVNDASGTWHCSDDANGSNPMIHLPSPPSGNYNIWVGTFADGALQPATLYISERSPK
jgi:hypothetical protein